MLAVKSVNVRDNFKEWCDKISMGETVVISRPRYENIYMINETEYNALQKAKRKVEYLAMLDKSDEELKAGKIVVKTMEELEAVKGQLPFFVSYGDRTRPPITITRIAADTFTLNYPHGTKSYFIPEI